MHQPVSIFLQTPTQVVVYCHTNLNLFIVLLPGDRNYVDPKIYVFIKNYCALDY